jgi:hypothetical protein
MLMKDLALIKQGFDFIPAGKFENDRTCLPDAFGCMGRAGGFDRTNCTRGVCNVRTTSPEILLLLDAPFHPFFRGRERFGVSSSQGSNSSSSDKQASQQKIKFRVHRPIL